MNAPHHFVLMMKSDQFTRTDFSSLKYALVGGSKVPLHVKTEMSYHLPNGTVNVGYGMSEIAGIGSVDYPISDKDTAGRLSDGIQMKIVDDHGNKCGLNEDGELCIKTTYQFLGYYGNQTATDELFDEEGFIMTGDIGHFDEDGDLFIVDRKKDLLKFCNHQISPSEIDAYLIGSPHIKSACVVGIPDVLATDLPAAVIVRNNGSNITEKEVFDLVSGNIEVHSTLCNLEMRNLMFSLFSGHFSDHCKLRGGVYFVDALPITPSGKLLRRKAKEIALELYNARLN